MKKGLPSNVKYDESASRASVITSRDGPKTFLSSSVPNLEFDFLPADINDLRAELDADRVCGVLPNLTTKDMRK